MRPRLELQLLHEMELPRTYGLVFIPAGSFQLVTDMDEVRESLRRIHAALRPGGTFVFEVGQQRPTESSSWPWGGKRFKRPDGRGIIILSWLGHYDATTGIAHDIHRYELVIDGQLVRTEIEEYDLRHYAHAELRALLEESGFGEVRTMKRYSSDPPDEKDEDVVVECVRA